MWKRPRIYPRVELFCWSVFSPATLHLAHRDSFCLAVCIGASSFHHCLYAHQEKLQGFLLAICQVKFIQKSGILTVIYSKVNLTQDNNNKKTPLRWKFTWYLPWHSLRSTDVDLGVFNHLCLILNWSVQAACLFTGT